MKLPYLAAPSMIDYHEHIPHGIIASSCREMSIVSESCNPSLVIPYKSVFQIPVILKQDGVAITFDGTLLFMVKKSKSDADEDAIISKELTIVNQDGDPYHAIISLTLDDTTQALGEYKFGFKTGVDGIWLPTITDTLEISDAIVQGQTA